MSTISFNSINTNCSCRISSRRQLIHRQRKSTSRAPMASRRPPAAAAAAVGSFTVGSARIATSSRNDCALRASRRPRITRASNRSNARAFSSSGRRALRCQTLQLPTIALRPPLVLRVTRRLRRKFASACRRRPPLADPISNPFESYAPPSLSEWESTSPMFGTSFLHCL